MVHNYAIAYMEDNNIVVDIEELEAIEGSLEVIDNNSTFDMISDVVDNVVNMRGDL